VVAPISTLDLTLASGWDIPIEEREIQEVTHFRGNPITPKGVNVFNPAFDVTPHGLIHAIITEKGIIRKPFHKNLKKMFSTPNSCTERFPSGAEAPLGRSQTVPYRTPNSKGT
jgi:methylthioribose-1-phosphate isomerase